MSGIADLRWMLAPLAICLVITGIHGYLGIHVLARKVIFVDLALAQIAALGTTYAYLLGYDPRDGADAPAVYLISLGFTIAGAAIFALTRMRREKVPQEAFIGIVYAVATALAILLLAKSAGEAEHIKQMLVGNVLLVTWPTVAKTALLYAAIGAFHIAFRRPFSEISTDPAAAAAAGRRVRLWDFAFYATFGLVITRSVAIAGVLLVFSFLIVPAVIAFLFQDGMRRRIVLAWAVGTACSAAGMLVSYYGDLPTGPSVVACFAALLVVAGLAHHVLQAANRVAALGRIGAGSVLAAALVALSLQARKAPAAHAHEAEFDALASALAGTDEGAQIEAIHHFAERKDPHAVRLLAAALAGQPSDRVAEHLVKVLPDFGEAADESVPALVAYAERDLDPFLRLEVATALLRLKSPAGFASLARVLHEDPPRLVEVRAAELLSEMVGQDFGLGRSAVAGERAQATRRYDEWVARQADRVRWRPDRRRFE